MSSPQTTLFRGSSEARTACETALRVRWSGAVPLYQRPEWAEIAGRERAWLLGVRDPGGQWRSGLALTVRPSRVLPGCYALRVNRAGSTIAREDAVVIARALHELADRSIPVLKVGVEIFARDPSLRAALGEALAGEGFERPAIREAYAQTVVIDIARDDEDTLLKSFSERVRRHVRALAKHPVEVRPIEDPSLAPRLVALMNETFARTEGESPAIPWPLVIEMSRRYPDASRVAGLFRIDRDGDDALLAFAWGCMHGDHAHYDAAASTRLSDLRMPLGYGPVWDLLRWSRRAGASWFDFGGVTAGSAGSGDPLGGISDFKRGFSSIIEELQEEWVYVPRPSVMRLARFGSSLSSAVSRLQRKY